MAGREFGAIVEHALADGVEDRERRALGAGLALQHQWWHGPKWHGLGHARRAVAPDRVGDLAPATRVADQHDVAQVELCDQLGQVVGVLVQVVTIPGLVGSSVATAVVRDHSVALLTQEQHLAIPGVGAERPAVAKQRRSIDLFGGQHVVLRAWVLGSGPGSAKPHNCPPPWREGSFSQHQPIVSSRKPRSQHRTPRARSSQIWLRYSRCSPVGCLLRPTSYPACPGVGIAPSCCIIVIVSNIARCSTIFPPTKRSRI